MPGWREETGVATRIAWGERRANDRRTGLVSGLWYPLDVIDGEPRENRRGTRGKEGSLLCLSVYLILFFIRRHSVTFADVVQ